ncbi:oxygen-independent coproporphyrinogen III oxidase [Calothrix sp. UHCC 0171]|uniref:oxygen-independent coproporphyrinogen III oxidase n=1 Tax=Calothrix sp. UHCC 0171 TaxID=3110245 RepID=UPI002B1F4D59|nr:oxygen-independent coproporphyrinogen III oxidase [Calothrix sp. UHCC 0171]MEA5572766.1 oxygen-independent coproporphyrinogen III oxidase [Calothrix sp. UHCC 0171]
MVFQVPGVKIDLELIKKYDTPTPRYTSYPPATELRESFQKEDFRDAIALSNQRQTPLSLYFHIPFCQSACYYCGCNIIVSGNKNIAIPYVEYLGSEIQQTAKLISPERPVVQIHWGGGTPNYLSKEQVAKIWKNIANNFTIHPHAEVSIEVNPRYIDKDYLFFLRELGFNRISFGLQDFDPKVQAAINRIQPDEMLFNVMGWMREAEFESINVDLIYGLPHQTLQSFRSTIKKTIELDPDRIAVFNFAYIPWVKAVQKNIDPDALTPPQEKLEILQMTIEELTRNKYLFIGMDHFAKPDDELATAQNEGSLQRNFQGYTTHGQAELLGFGATSVSMLHEVYAQNHKQLKDYYQAIDAGILPVSKGYKLNWEDILRRDVIMGIMSGTRVNKQEIEQKYQIDFNKYFAQEMQELQRLENDGLVDLSNQSITITEIGRLLVRNIAVIFDAHKVTRERKLSRAI